jgi:hypothetical protein
MSMPHSEVPSIELTPDGKITLNVRVCGFDPGMPVELSGHATQDNGAIATFHTIVQMPADGTGDVIFPVAGVAVIGQFVDDAPIMVVTRAADVWVSKLVNDQKGWNSDESSYHSALVPDQPPLSPPVYP